jgi:hypothetical protein
MQNRLPCVSPLVPITSSFPCSDWSKRGGGGDESTSSFSKAVNRVWAPQFRNHANDIQGVHMAYTLVCVPFARVFPLKARQSSNPYFLFKRWDFPPHIGLHMLIFDLVAICSCTPHLILIPDLPTRYSCLGQTRKMVWRDGARSWASGKGFCSECDDRVSPRVEGRGTDWDKEYVNKEPRP